ncbi:unnamed protein product [Merluccius merluccius]
MDGFIAAAIVRKRQWCEMFPCLEDEGCDLLVNRSGWTCTQPGGRVKTTTMAESSGDPLTDSPHLLTSSSTITMTTINVGP